MARVEELLDWLESSRGDLAGRVLRLSDRAHPVANQPIGVLLRGSETSVTELLRNGGAWDAMGVTQRADVVGRFRAILDREMDAVLAVDSASIRTFVPEIDELKRFYGYWQELSEAERRVVSPLLLDFPL